MTNHKAIADHLAHGSSPAEIAVTLHAPLADVEQCVAALQSILRETTTSAVRDRLIQMGYGAASVAPWSAEAFTRREVEPTVAPAA